MYYRLSPEEIFEDISRSRASKKIKIKDREFVLHPRVYPSDKFRTTNFLLDHIRPLLQNATVCDMGCGMGIIGLFALQQNAKNVVQADISKLAVKNARVNIRLCHYSDKQIKVIESDCFDNVPKQAFDVIIFNIPFHNSSHKIEDPLEYAFYDPKFMTTKKFLSQIASYCHPKTKIIIAFSSKGDVAGLERLFNLSSFKWKLWKIANEDQEYDNRLYLLQTRLKKPRENHVNELFS